MELNELVGEHILSGIETGTKQIEGFWGEETCNFVKFTLDGVTYLALEDPDDGYRSYMEELQIVEERCKFPLPNVKVICVMRKSEEEYGFHQEDDILSFIDAISRKEILAIGTANTDDYYPWCVMEYYPQNMACNGAERAKCKWLQDEVCVNADCPVCADFCPVVNYPGVCRYEVIEDDREAN